MCTREKEVSNGSKDASEHEIAFEPADHNSNDTRCSLPGASATGRPDSVLPEGNFTNWVTRQTVAPRADVARFPVGLRPFPWARLASPRVFRLWRAQERLRWFHSESILR